MTTKAIWAETERPTLETTRLLLRPFALSDAKDVQRMAGHPLIAATTASIPHPYPDGAAEDWIGRQAEWFEQKQNVHFAITLRAHQTANQKPTPELIGCISLFGYSALHAKAELGYWIGIEHWNKGFCTEAAQSVVDYGFERMNLNKITARHIDTNPSSGRVMTKTGLTKEGVLRQDHFKNGVFHDMLIYGLTRSDRPRATATAPANATTPHTSPRNT
jgi:RimJ/RimL family protein N-acetyltransferase